MAKAVKYVSKKKGNSEYKSYLGETDYNIPVFGWKSSFLILISCIIPLFLVPWMCDLLSIDYRLPTVIIGGLSAGYMCAYTQFCIERKKGFTKNFWIVGGLVSLVCCAIIFVLVYTGNLL